MYTFLLASLSGSADPLRGDMCCTVLTPALRRANSLFCAVEIPLSLPSQQVEKKQDF